MLRITSGIHRGRLIQSLPGTKTRPTTERLRQAWLNSLQMGIPDSRVLDLFSGSGALGLEALSRGASFAVFVEENPKAAAVIQQNINALDLRDQCKILVKKVEKCASFLVDEPPFQFIFADPPYQLGHEEKLLSEWAWEQVLSDEGRLCIESSARKEGGFLPPPSSLKIVRDERYGDSQLTFYALRRSTE